ncbi:uncharacterized protein LOC130161080 [Seriola aureovittata]|uniref:uncharacterized protein LOC130161080 n=1 Tax=Seriola aureovittata TaxID=2871759 RepID=UPI0024BDE00A|nr:uncharacterized protein LOC130161080 [Seriola aureovittata]
MRLVQRRRRRGRFFTKTRLTMENRTSTMPAVLQPSWTPPPSPRPSPSPPPSLMIRTPLISPVSLPPPADSHNAVGVGSAVDNNPTD